MVEIEVDDGANGNLMFHPAAVAVRGRFDPVKVPGEGIGELCRLFPGGVPGQTIRFDPATNTGSILEPLHDKANAPVRAALEKRLTDATPHKTAVEFDPAVREYQDQHAGTWLGWMRRAVASGAAKLVRGKLPDADPPDMKRGFFTNPRQPDHRDQLIEKLTGLLVANLPADKRKELAGLLGTK